MGVLFVPRSGFCVDPIVPDQTSITARIFGLAHFMLSAKLHQLVSVHISFPLSRYTYPVAVEILQLHGRRDET